MNYKYQIMHHRQQNEYHPQRCQIVRKPAVNAALCKGI